MGGGNQYFFKFQGLNRYMALGSLRNNFHLYNRHVSVDIVCHISAV